MRTVVTWMALLAAGCGGGDDTLGFVNGGPPPGVSGGGQIGGGRNGGTGPSVASMGESFYWLQNTSRKVQPTTAAGASGGTLAIEGARGATESYQIVLRGSLTGVDATASVLVDGMGDMIPSANVKVFREGFTNFTGISTMGGVLPAPAKSPTGDGLVPDVLIPLHDPYTGNPAGAPFDVAASTNQPLWIDVRIPGDAAYGTYTGSITFQASGTTIVVPLAVTVWNITIPDMRAIPAWFRLDYNYLEDFHANVHNCYYSRCAADSPERAVITHYQQLMHEHRIDPMQTLVPYPNGCTTPDFRDFDAAIAPYMDGSYWSDGVPSSLYQVPIEPEGDAKSVPQSCGHDAFVSVARAWAQHLKDKGYWDRTYSYGEDEPPSGDLSTIAQQAGWMDEADPGYKPRVFVTTAATNTSAPILDPTMGLYVQCLKCFDSWNASTGGYYGRAEWPARWAAGFNFWFYESNAQGPPYMGLATNTLDAAEPRIMMWGSWYEGAKGFLYWAVNSWDLNDPWGPTIGFNKTGDGMIIYPGDHSGTDTGKGSPAGITIAGGVASIRLKMVRSGLQDWALFLLADRTNLRDMAKAEVAAVYGQLGGCTYQGCKAPVNGSFFWKTDYDLMTTARRHIVNALLATVH
jgi:glycosyl hydrolase family 123